MASDRNFRLAEELSNYYSSVNVVSSSNKYFFPKEKVDLCKLKVRYLPTLDYSTFSKPSTNSGVSKEGSIFKIFMRKLKNSFPFCLLLGQGGFLFIISSVLYGLLKVRRSKNYSLLTPYGPYSNLFIGYFIKRINPKIEWIVDFHHSHLVSYNENQFLWEGLEKRIFDAMIQRADRITLVSEGLIDQFSYFDIPINVVELGIDRIVKESNVPSPYFTINYSGSLYPDQQFDIVLKALIKLEKQNKLDSAKVRLQYAGVNGEQWKQRLSKYPSSIVSKDLGLLNSVEARKVQGESQINLLLSWNKKGIDTIIPGKYYDYLSVQKPILLVINGESDLNWEGRFHRLKPGHLCYDNVDNLNEVSNYIEMKYQEWEKKGSVEVDYNQEELEKYFIKYQVAQYFQK